MSNLTDSLILTIPSVIMLKREQLRIFNINLDFKEPARSGKVQYVDYFEDIDSAIYDIQL